MALIDNVDLLNQIFDGFVPSNGKVPTVKDWGNNHITLSNVAKNDSFGGVINENFACIDADDKLAVDMLMSVITRQKLNCVVIRTTKGIHAYFRNKTKQAPKNVASHYTLLNCKVDYRVRVGKVGFCVLKLNGVERDIIYNTGTIDELPFYLKPLTKFPIQSKENTFDFPTLRFNKTETFDRNYTYFGYMCKLMMLGYSDDDIKTVIRVINSTLEVPKPDSELEGAVLDEVSFSKAHSSIDELKGVEFNYYRTAQGETCKQIALAIKRYNDLNTKQSFIGFNCGRGLYEISKDATGTYNSSFLKFSNLKSKITTNAYSWLSGVNKDGEKIYEQPSDAVFRNFADSSEQDLDIPKFKNISNGAFLTQNARLVNKFGLDAETGIFLTRDIAIPTIPKNPSVDDIERAKAIIMNVLNEFAFEREEGDKLEDNVNYQNAVFALIIAAFRPSLAGATPIYAVSKNSERVGASLLSSVISLLAYSQSANMSSVSVREEENEKLIQSLIIGNPCYQILDNVTAKTSWVTPTLLTCTSGNNSFSFRQLGTAKTIISEKSTFWVINGINIDNFSADVTGRLFLTRLATPKSWQNMRFTRTRDELLKLAKSEHGNVIWSIGVMLNYWISQNRPAAPKNNGNFTEYPQLSFIIDMMHCAGYTNVLSNLEEMQKNNNEAEITGSKLMTILSEKFQNGTFTTSDLINEMKNEAFQHVACNNYDYDADISSILLTESEIKMVDNISTTKIGTLLAQYLNRAYTDATCKLTKIKVRGQRVYKLTLI